MRRGIPLGISASSVVLLFYSTVDRFAANTLRTLGIIAVAICMLLASGILLLGALCFSTVAH